MKKKIKSYLHLSLQLKVDREGASLTSRSNSFQTFDPRNENAFWVIACFIRGGSKSGRSQVARPKTPNPHFPRSIKWQISDEDKEILEDFLNLTYHHRIYPRQKLVEIS